jgi:hypothetical protein
VHLGLGRHQLGQHPGQPDRVRAQRGPHPVVPGGGRVALVEDQVDDLEHGGQPGRPLRRARHLERHLLTGQRALGADDPLRDRGLGQQVGAGDLGGGQAAEHAQGQGDPGRGREYRVAGGEHQPQKVILDLVRVGRREPGSVCLCFQVPAQLGVPALEFPVAPEQVHGPALGDGHQPGSRRPRDPLGRPLLERGDHRVLGQILGQPQVTGVPGQPGDQPRRLQPDHGLDRRVGPGLVLGHSYPSDHDCASRSLRAAIPAAFPPRSLGAPSSRLIARQENSAAALREQC